MITRELLMTAYYHRAKAKGALKAQETITGSEPTDEIRLAYIDADNAVRAISNTLSALNKARGEKAS